MLAGRSAERARLASAVDAARRGAPSVLVVTGEAGIGKSALLEELLDATRDVTALWVQGAEAEAPVPYAGLHAALLPVLHHLDDLPGPQADALASAFALRTPSGPVDRFGVGAATLTLLGLVSQDGPVVVAVDDGQWIDQASWQALLFAVRRLDAERVAVLITWRDDEPLPRDLDGVERLHLTGLPLGAVAGVLAPRRVSRAIAATIHAATGGNPLALRELARTLDDAHLDGRRPLPDPLPVGRDVVARFGHRVADLPEPTRLALLVLAAGRTLTAGEHVTATRALGLRDDAIEPAEAADLVVRRQGRVALGHPLMRSAVYWSVAPPERRRVHAALAGAVGDPVTALWHRAESLVGPDEATAVALGEAAADASRRGAFGTAARAFERAAELSADPGAATLRLLLAGEAALHAGNHAHAGGLLRRVVELATDAEVCMAATRLAARNELWAGNVAAARATLEAAARGLQADDPAAAAMLLADAVMPTLASGDVQTAAELGRRARALVPPDAVDLAAQVALLTLPARVCSGEPASELLSSVPPPPADADDADPALAGLVALPLMWLEQYDDARTLLHDALLHARRVNAPAHVPLVLTSLAELELRTGDVLAAQAHATEAIRLAEGIGRRNELALGHVALARWAAVRGDAALVDAHVRAARPIVEESSQGSTDTSLAAIRGLVCLGRSDVDEAVVHLSAAARLAAAHGLVHPAVVPWRGDLVEALVRADRRGDAEREVEALEREAAATGSRWATGAAARGRLLLAGADELDEALGAAITAQTGVGQPFERARTLLVAGEQLRRHRRRKEARQLLAEAVEAFEVLGATVWRERAEAELGATGARRTRAVEPGVVDLDALTPQELQVALAVAEGGTNREVAASLFLSPKTVESHLGRVFRKLGVRSRSELTALVLKEWEGRGRR